MGDQKKDERKGDWLRFFLAGGVAGAVSRTVTAPFDRLKVAMQLHGAKVNMVTYMKNLVEEGGIKGLWRGNLANVLKIAPDTAVKFSVYKNIKGMLKGNEGNALTFHERFIAGAIAGSVSQSAVYPIDVLKTRLMIRKEGQYTGMVDCIRKLYAKEGIHCFYRGFVANLLGIVPMAGIELAVYETLREMYSRTHKRESIWVVLGSSCISGTLGQIVNFPFSLIKIQQQVHEGYPVWTIRYVTRKIIKEHGILGMYIGLTPSIFKIVPSICISYIIFEYSSKVLGISMG